MSTSLPLNFHMGRCEPVVQHMIVVPKYVKLRPLQYHKPNSVHMQDTCTRLYTQLLLHVTLYGPCTAARVVQDCGYIVACTVERG